MSIMSVIAKALEVDPAGGSALMSEVVYSYLSDQSEVLRPEIDALIGQYVSHRVNVAKRQIAKSYVESIVEGHYPEDSVQKHAEWIAGIESYVIRKDEEDTFDRSYGSGTRKITVHRGAGGRFSRGISNVERIDPRDIRNKKAIAPIAVNAMKDGKWNFKVETEDDKARVDRIKAHQAQFDQANTHVSDILNAFQPGDYKNLEIAVHVQDPRTGNIKSIPVRASDIAENGGFLPHAKFDSGQWRSNENLLSIDVNPRRGLTNSETIGRVDAYNTLGLANNSALQQYYMTNPETRTAFQNSLAKPKDGSRSVLSRFFDTVRTGGNVLYEIDPTNQFGHFARFMGEVGPEAEKVLGPYVQEAAYRYRGTEKEPDLDLVRQFNSNSMRAVEIAAESRDPQSKIAQTIRDAALEGKNRSSSNDLVMQAAGHEIDYLSRSRGGAFTPDELRLNVRADVAARHLLNTLPTDPFIAEVSRKAGNILPSQGVIIDADGDVVSQSVGYADDHYLPFDFKNLKSLQGGQYVRTRQQGGLTSEDIYTAARTGTRMATVVSSSGVFSLEFDPNFRGGRANTDRARQLYDRYVKILDAVDASGLYVSDLSPAEKEIIASRARMVVAQRPNGESFKDVNQRMLDNAREKSKNLDSETLKAIELEARKQVEDEGRNYSKDRFERRVSDVFDEKVGEERNKRVSELSLNSKGYEVALQTLQQQFPYYIRNVSYHPLTSNNPGEGFLQNLSQSGAAGARQKLYSSDKGYVRPFGMKANSLRGGYYRTAGEMRTKASSLDYESDGATEPKSTAGAAGSTGTPGAKSEVAGGASAPIERTPLPTGGLAGLIMNANKARMADFQPEIETFSNGMVMPERAIPPVVRDANGSWEEAKVDKTKALRWLMNRDNALLLPKVIESDGPYVAELLSDGKAVSSMAKSIYGSTDPEDLGPDFDTYEDVANYVSEFGEKLSDVVNAEHPFINPLDGEDSAFYTGSVPQLFDEIQAIGSQSDLGTFATNPANKKTFNITSSLLYDEKGDERSDSAINKLAKENIGTLKSLKEGLSSVSFGTDTPTVDDLAKATKIPRDKIRSALGLDTEEGQAALGLNENGLDSYGFFGINEDVVVDRAMDYQKGWSLATAVSYLNKVGGEEAPKDLMAKSHLSKNLGFSSRRVQVVSKHHPLAQVVQQRRRLNLPLL